VGAESYSNVYGPEGKIHNRGPAVTLALQPVALVDGLHLDGELAGTRYGPWVSGRPTELLIAAPWVRLAYLERLGPVRVTASVSQHTVLTQYQNSENSALVFTQIGASASTALRKRYESLTHLVKPALRFAGLPIVNTQGGQVDTTLDERLGAEKFEQVEVELAQAWYRSRTTSEAAHLNIRQPFDIEGGRPLATHFELGWNVAGWMRTSFSTAVDFRRDAYKVQELNANVDIPMGPLGFNGRYSRWSPDSERFVRSVYQLAGFVALPTDPAELDAWETRWVHQVAINTRLYLGNLKLWAGLIALLPLPDQAGAPNPVNALRPFVSVYTLRADYASECKCWGLSANASIPGQNPEDFRISLQIYLGSAP